MNTPGNPPPVLSLIVPTRERREYLGYALQTCVRQPVQDMEILVLDNASGDNSLEVVDAIGDPRIAYHRSDRRLSMRDNFERGCDIARGEIICFIGDDDGILPDAIPQVLKLFRDNGVDALSADRAHYAWPDLLSGRRNTALIPRHRGFEVLDSRVQLRSLLTDDNYYKLPCVYHGFVRRSVVKEIQQKQGRMFLSSQVDMFSAIALSMEAVRYVFSRTPFIVNGGSQRSNGAAHFGGGGQEEKALWKKEDDIGFLPGFADSATVGALIIESALRYVAANGCRLADVLDREDILSALSNEAHARLCQDRPIDATRSMYHAAGVEMPLKFRQNRRSAARAVQLGKAFLKSCPVDMDGCGVHEVDAAAQRIGGLLANRRTHLWNSPMAQLSTALRMYARRPAEVS
ncbi:MAG: glycosyltransferase family 2 protein [Sphingomonas sp.]